MKELGKIRNLYYRDGVSLSEIARKTGYCRNTIKRWLKMPEGVEPKYRRQHHDTKIALYAVQLIKAGNGSPRSPRIPTPCTMPWCVDLCYRLALVGKYPFRVLSDLPSQHILSRGVSISLLILHQNDSSYATFDAIKKHAVPLPNGGWLWEPCSKAPSSLNSMRTAF